MDKPPFNIPDAASFEGHRIPVSLSDLTPSDRLKHHRKVMRTIAFNQGLDGVNRYKAENPEAAPIRVNIATLAYSPKPKGYDQYLVDLVRSWLTSPTALASTNLQDVDRLNSHFQTTRFNPAQHFSEALSNGRLGKLRAVFAEHGVQLDTAKASSLSKVRRAAKAHRAACLAANPTALDCDNIRSLIVGDRAYPISSHHGHDCIRISVAGKQVRIRADALAALSGEAFDSGGNGCWIKYSPVGTIRELVPDDQTPDFDPLADEQISDVVPECGTSGNEIPDVVPDETPLSLSDRLAALKAALPSHSPNCPDGVDPLTL